MNINTLNNPVTDSVYELKNVQHFYGKQKVLDIPGLAVLPGTITGLAGPNGSGKSTLLKLLAFAMRPSHGEILFNNSKAFPFSDKAKFNVTLLTQEPYLLKRTVFENIIYGLKIRGESRGKKDKASIEKVSRAMKYVGLDYEKFAHRKWNQLSGGEAQRVAMAARIVIRPQVLLLDEPTASVDIESADLIRKASIIARNKWHSTILVASHDQNWLKGVCDNYIHMSKGKISHGNKEKL